MTAPQPPSHLTERIGSVGPEVSIMPGFIKVLFLSLGISEILVILANAYPSIGVSRTISKYLVHASPPQEIRLTWTFIFAWAVCLSGALIRRRCYQVMGQMFTFEISLRKNHKLVTSGPYSFVRHPSYTSGAMALFGALMTHTSPGSWAMECSGIFSQIWTGHSGLIIIGAWIIAAILGFFVIAPRLDIEDDLLKSHFGSEWEAWAERVPYRLVPGLY
ncbi:hypothetical protein CPC08DRAFT_763990 [Agrocybe pediades]|nr:hypothetical protein CPC08DRAFT_763990 [Agrocybe pediades]